MTHQEFSKKGGQSKSKAKLEALKSNLAKARKKLAESRGKLKKEKPTDA